MQLNDHPETDSLYIDLLERPGAGSQGIWEGVVLDYDAESHLLGIDFDNGSTKVELKGLILGKLPGRVETDAA